MSRRPRTHSPAEAGFRFNLALAAALALVNLHKLFVLPLWLLPQSPAWALTLLPLGLLDLTLWALIHEAVHGLLHPSRRVNELAGRALACLFGAPFELLRRGHLLHHAYNRTERERTEVFDRRRQSRRLFAVGYYARLLGGLYAAEAGASLLLALPGAQILELARRVDRGDNVLGLMLRGLSARSRLRSARQDAIAIAVVHGLAFACYGRLFWILLGAVALRALLISLADNVYHYGTQLDAVRNAMNLRLPELLQKSYLHFNLHGVHHREPQLCWFELPREFARSGARYEASFAEALVRQLRGPAPA